MRGLKQRFEIHHGVTIQDKAIISAATLSNRYITDRFLPDKAIDLIDEACATIRVQMDSVPTALDTLTRKIMKLEIEREALKKEKDELSKKRIEEIDSELGKLKEKEKTLKDSWNKEKHLNEEIKKKKTELEKARFDLEQAENSYDLNRAAILKHGEIPKLEGELKELNHQNENKILSNVVDRVIFMEKGQITNEWSMDQFRHIDHRDYGLRQLNLKKLVVNHSEYYSNNHEMIELKNFNFKYGKNQVLNIDEVKIPKNEIIAVIGKNGAGKSTFANCLCGLKKSCKGEIIWGDNHLKRKDLLKKTYMVMQDVNHQLFTESVLDEVLLSMDDENICVAEEILTNLNLIHLKEMHPMALSGGEKQRVAIASAIASGKEFLIFDEPTSGLDLKNMMKVSENLVYLQKLGVTSFIITHDFELIMEVCSHILHMEDGKIIDNYKINEEKLENFFLKN